MANRPQNSPKGLFVKKKIGVADSSGNVSYLTSNSTGLALDGALQLSGSVAHKLTGNSTGLVLSGGVKISNQANGVLTANSTGVNAVGSVAVSGQATFGKLSANSTALILPNSVRVGTKTTYLSSDSTGMKLGSRYVSTNTTGNSVT